VEQSQDTPGYRRFNIRHNQGISGNDQLSSGRQHHGSTNLIAARTALRAAPAFGATRNTVLLPELRLVD
jgi:hypothetical protein